MGFSDFLFGSKGTPSTVQTVTSPTFGFNERARNISSGFLTDQLQAVGRGELPEFFQQQIPALRAGLDQGAATTFFGQPGRRGEGLVSQALGIGAQTGVGPRAAVAGTNKQLQNFAQRKKDIDQFIAQQGVQIANQVAQNFPGQINAAPQGPPSQSFVVPGQAGTEGFLSKTLGQATGALLGAATGNPFAALGGIFGGGGGGGNAVAGNIGNSFNLGGGGGFGIPSSPVGQGFGQFTPGQLSGNTDLSQFTGI
jgi:hypothetical protein